ncbi:MAG: hypothetical protein ACR2HB_05870 [Dehalococcoidia bacterium]
METATVVGGGLAEWDPGKGPRGETVAPCAYVDAGNLPALLELPPLFHRDPTHWQAAGRWLTRVDTQHALLIQVTSPTVAEFTIVFGHARMAPFLAAIERSGSFYLCPTTAKLGVNARLARDHSVPVEIIRAPAEGH